MRNGHLIEQYVGMVQQKVQVWPRWREMKMPDDLSAMVRASEGAGVGIEADSGRARLLEEHGEALAAVRQLATVR